MQIKKLADLLPYCKENLDRKRLVVIKAEDDHTLTAVLKAVGEGVITPVLIGKRPEIERLIKEINPQSEDYEIIDIEDEKEAALTAARMVQEGKADFLMKGTIETKNLMQVMVSKEAGMRTGKIMSKFDFMEIPGYHKLFALSDSALNTKPDLEKKKQIIENALEVLYSTGIEKPKVAVLAAAETLNPKLQESVDAYELKQMYDRGEFPPCYLEGPISIDLALDPESVRVKKYDSPVGGDADLLICPDLVSGNLMGKGMLLTGARAAGIIVGAKAPIVLMSRSASVEDKMLSIFLGAIASGNPSADTSVDHSQK